MVNQNTLKHCCIRLVVTREAIRLIKLATVIPNCTCVLVSCLPGAMLNYGPGYAKRESPFQATIPKAALKQKPRSRKGKHLQKCAINSLAPGRFQFNIRQVIFKLTLVNGGWSISNEIILRWMPLDLTDDKSTLVQVMAWCRQATSYYLSQCWPRSMSPNGVTRPQWVNSLPLVPHICMSDSCQHWFR